MVSKRIIKAEILDHLMDDDPKAIRSRQDLKLINAFMGNHRWILQRCKTIFSQSALPCCYIEIGAGDGSFSRRLQSVTESMVVGVDLINSPFSLPHEIEWLQGNILTFDALPFKKKHLNIVVCNLILHHFDSLQLSKIAALCSGADHIIIVEPWRSQLAKCLALLAFPFVNGVTRHDMMVSIEAGFIPSELPLALRSSGKRNVTYERIDYKGGLRLHLQ